LTVRVIAYAVDDKIIQDVYQTARCYSRRR